MEFKWQDNYYTLRKYFGKSKNVIGVATHRM